MLLRRGRKKAAAVQHFLFTLADRVHRVPYRTPAPARQPRRSTHSFFRGRSEFATSIILRLLVLSFSRASQTTRQWRLLPVPLLPAVPNKPRRQCLQSGLWAYTNPRPFLFSLLRASCPPIRRKTSTHGRHPSIRARAGVRWRMS